MANSANTFTRQLQYPHNGQTICCRCTARDSINGHSC